MCGIAGLAWRDASRPVERATLQRLSAAIRHRGPDDEGSFIANNVGLAMRRLSIIDVGGGHQPIANEDGTRVIVLNGEIYNYRELRRGLTARGHQFRSQSDTETVLHLYEEMGAECVTRLRGMFAFAIWDATRHEMFLARDRFGIKPLYYVLDGEGLAFASELRALSAAGLTRRDLDWDGIDAFFQLGYIPAPRSPFRDVVKLEPGHTLTWSPSRGGSVKRYWDLPNEPPRDGPTPDAVRAWIDDAVSSHLESDVPVAAFLSGGLDSSAVVSSVAAQGRDIEAFTVRYTGAGAAAADESALAAQLAARYKLRLNIVDVGPGVIDRFDDIVAALDEPNADDSALPTWMLCRAVGARYKVALTGTGGDELFAGYRRHLALGAAQRYAILPSALRRTLSRLASLLPESAGGGLAINRLKRFARVGAARTPDAFLALLTRSPDLARTALYGAPRVRPWVRSHFNALHARAGELSGIRAARYFDYKTFLPDDILALADRIGMAHGLELRVPFVDHELVERAFALSHWALVAWGKPKRLLRAAIAPRLPAEHLRAPKRGFVGPTAAWLRTDLRNRLRDELSPDRLHHLGQFDGKVVARWLEEHETGRQNHEGILWALLTFSSWQRAFVERPAPVELIGAGTAVETSGQRRRQPA